jgi:hypothetical protein
MAARARAAGVARTPRRGPHPQGIRAVQVSTPAQGAVHHGMHPRHRIHLQEFQRNPVERKQQRRKRLLQRAALSLAHLASGSTLEAEIVIGAVMYVDAICGFAVA